MTDKKAQQQRQVGEPVPAPAEQEREEETGTGRAEHPTVEEETPQEPPRRLDETIPGGKYLMADRKTLVNCWGQRIDEQGNILDEKRLPPE